MNIHSSRALYFWFSPLLCAFLVACGGGSSGSGGGTGNTYSTDTPSPEITFALPNSASLTIGNSLSNPATSSISVSGAGAISYTSNNTAVATVDSSGVVIGIGSGTATISATQAAVSGINTQATQTFLLTVISPDPNIAAGWTLDWSDEFNGTSLNTTIWNYDLGGGGWGNNELEYYQAQNAVVQNGYLTITAMKQTVGGSSYTSARIQTAQKKTFTYGRFEIMAKLPSTQGMWPAFWLLGATCNSFGLYGGTVPWPDCGEIDVMEMIGGGAGDYTTHGTIHYATGGPTASYTNSEILGAAFHRYTIDWTPQGFTWYFDGIPYEARTTTAGMSVFQTPFFLVLNFAVGGAWPGNPDSTSVFPQTYVIDYVRHYH